MFKLIQFIDTKKSSIITTKDFVLFLKSIEGKYDMLSVLKHLAFEISEPVD